MKIITEDLMVEDGPQFRIVWNAEKALAKFSVYEICGWDFMDSKRVMFATDEFPEEEFSKAIPYLTGMIKWDGCSNFEQRETHLCGQWAYLKHMLLMKYLYNRSAEVMGRETLDCQFDPSWEIPESHVREI